MAIPHKLRIALALESVENLRTRIDGDVILPEETRYNEARLTWNRAIDQHPAIIIVAQHAADVATAVQFARSEGLSVAVQSTGHGIIRPANDDLLIITSRMTGVRVDAVAQTAWIEAGVKWGAVLEKTQAVGLAPLLGSSPGVGVVGYTLGGGMGWLARKYGLAADSVRHFELVTADGQMIRASADENSDIFWALRGGGGNFGIVTAMEIRLYPVTTVYGGSLIFPIENAKAVFAQYRDWIADAPDEQTSSIALMNFPPILAVPQPLRGKSAVMINGCYCGPVEHGEARLQTWLKRFTPIANSFRAMPFSEVATISNDPVDPLPGSSTGAWLRDLSDEVAQILIEYGVGSPITKTEVRHAGGAIARVDPLASAYGNRDASLILNLISLIPSPEARLRNKQHVAELKRALQPHLTGGVYMNFLDGDEVSEQTRDAYSSEAYQRLTALKAQTDPDNLFRYGFDIPPVSAR